MSVTKCLNSLVSRVWGFSIHFIRPLHRPPGCTWPFRVYHRHRNGISLLLSHMYRSWPDRQVHRPGLQVPRRLLRCPTRKRKGLKGVRAMDETEGSLQPIAIEAFVDSMQLDCFVVLLLSTFLAIV